MKKAFTLAEVLIVLMIIGVLIGLCIGAGTAGLRNAYNLYYYNTISSLYAGYNSFLYSKEHEQTDASTGEVTAVDDVQKAFCNYFAELIDQSCSSKKISYTGPEGGDIEFDFSQSYSSSQFYKISVTIPMAKMNLSSNDGTAEYVVLYSIGYSTADGEYSGYDPIFVLVGNESGNNIVDNVGVLPTYIDDGKVGRVIRDSSGSTSYSPIIPLSYRQSFCAALDTSSETSPFSSAANSGFDVSSYCSGISTDSEKQGKPLKFLKPRNIL